MAKRRANSVRATGNRSEAGAKAGKASKVGDLEKAFYVAVVSFAVTLTALLAHGAAYSGGELPVKAFEQPGRAGRSPVYGRAMGLAAKYDSRPYWHMPKLVVGEAASRATADLAIAYLIPCESGGKTVHHLDSNGKMSYGILQFQDWDEWERVSGIHGDPDNSDDAIRMAEWGIEHGMIDHWGCAKILGLM
jgi:hypothetical protein